MSDGGGVEVERISGRGTVATPARGRTDRRSCPLPRPAPADLGSDRADARPVAGRHPATAPGAPVSRLRSPGRPVAGRDSSAAPLFPPVPTGPGHAAARLDTAPVLRPDVARAGPRRRVDGPPAAAGKAAHSVPDDLPDPHGDQRLPDRQPDGPRL